MGDTGKTLAVTVGPDDTSSHLAPDKVVGLSADKVLWPRATAFSVLASLQSEAPPSLALPLHASGGMKEEDARVSSE